MTATEAAPKTGRIRMDPIKPYPMQTAPEKHEAYLRRWTKLKAERSDWDTHWADLSEFILPRAARFTTTERNRADEASFSDIFDNTASRAVRVLSAGMMAGMTSPARPWFQLRTRDPNLRDSHAVRLWLDDTRDRMQAVFAASNVYRVLPRTYKELGVFGMSALMVLGDFDTVIRCYPLSIGEYCLQQDYQGRITTVYREFSRSVVEVVKEFGFENCSLAVQQDYNDRNLDREVELLHVVEPRADQDRRFASKESVDMPWRSVYMEIAENEKILRESGFRRMRVLVPRWDVEGGDVYGSSCPGMESLGDIKQLQQEQLRKSQAIDYQTRPPLQVPQSVKDRPQDYLPEGISYYEPATILGYDQATPHGGIRSAWEVQLELQHLLVDIQDVRQRIESSFYVDLFLMIAQHDGRMTATEVIERQEEKLLMVGPVIERLANELLEPLIDITFYEMLEVGALLPPPPELEGAELQVDFISILAQAQRAVGISSTQQYMSDVLTVAQAQAAVQGSADVLDNINLDKWARETALMRGVDSDMLVEEGAVRTLRETRAAKMAAAEQAQMMSEQAKTVKDLGTTPVNQDTALQEILQRLSGFTPAGAA